MEVRQGSHGTGGEVEVVRDEVRQGVEAPGSLVVGGVGKLLSLQPVEVVLASAEGERPAEVRGEVGDGVGLGGGEDSLSTPIQVMTGGGVITTQVRAPIPLLDLSCLEQHGEPSVILL